MKEQALKKNDLLFVVLSAPSGAGKTTIARTFLERRNDFMFSVSATTRQPRGDEQHGVDYFYHTEDSFREMIRNEQMLEWAEVHGNLYGSPLSMLSIAEQENKHLVFDIDVQGGLQIKNRYPEHTLLIFIMPPSKEILESRLKSRSTDSPETIEKRLKNAQKEITIGFGKYEFVIVNDTVEQAVQDLSDVVDGAFHRAVYKREVFETWLK